MEDMLRACALDYGSSWDDNLPYAEFSYNNSYQTSLKMAPFEALYGRSCRTPLMWDEVGDRQLFGPDLIEESEEKVKLIRDRLKVAQSRQKSYADSKRKEVVYEIGDRVYLRVSPLRGVKCWGMLQKIKKFLRFHQDPSMSSSKQRVIGVHLHTFVDRERKHSNERG